VKVGIERELIGGSVMAEEAGMGAAEAAALARSAMENEDEFLIGVRMKLLEESEGWWRVGVLA
jgi:hypothetical protein